MRMASAIVVRPACASLTPSRRSVSPAIGTIPGTQETSAFFRFLAFADWLWQNTQTRCVQGDAFGKQWARLFACVLSECACHESCCPGSTGRREQDFAVSYPRCPRHPAGVQIDLGRRHSAG